MGQAQSGTAADAREWEKYRKVCAQMSLEEAAEVSANPTPWYKLTIYWFLNLLACGESVLRLALHVIGCVFWAVPLFLTRCMCADKAPTFFATQYLHHYFFLSVYWAGYSMLCYNLCQRPSSPIYVFSDFISLERPPVPRAPLPVNKCCPCEAICAALCAACQGGFCRSVLSVQERFIRSIYFSFSGCRSCHPSVPCGPCCQDHCCYESLPTRMVRWQEEYNARVTVKTKAFYQKYYQCDSYSEIGVVSSPRDPGSIQLISREDLEKGAADLMSRPPELVVAEAAIKMSIPVATEATPIVRATPVPLEMPFVYAVPVEHMRR